MLDGTNYNNNVIQDPENICQVMADNDMAIVTFGQTAYELAVLDIPALYICLTGDHCQSAEIFVKEGFGSLIGEYQNIDALSIITKVESFLLNYSGGVFNKKLNRKPVISDMKLISSLIIDGT